VARFSGGAAAPVVQKDSAVTYEVKVVFERAALICLCLELGDLATSRGGACMAVRPARPPPSYAATPRASSEATSARGGRARHRNTRAAPGAHRGPSRGSDALPGGVASGRCSGAVAGPSSPMLGGPGSRHRALGQRR
jgi:hypothetical protein